MRIEPDDEIYRVDAVFLGPERFRLPWRWTYRQYGIAVAAFLVIQAVQRQLGIDLGVWPLAFGALITVWITVGAQRTLNWDRGVRVALTELRLELLGPRADTRIRHVALQLPRTRQARRQRAATLAATYEPADHSDSTPPPHDESHPDGTERRTPVTPQRRGWRVWRRRSPRGEAAQADELAQQSTIRITQG